jgi:putative ATP-binding cassette transporter
MPRDNLLTFFLKEIGMRGKVALAIALASGGLHAWLICVLAFGIAQTTRPGELSVALTFLAGALLLLVGEYVAQRRVSLLSEEAIGRISLRLTARIRDIDLLDLERIGPQRLLDTMARDLGMVAAMQRVIFALAATGVMGIVLLVVLLSIAPVIGVMMVIIGIVTARSPEVKRLTADEARAAKFEQRFVDLLRSAIAGYTELKLDASKWRDMYHRGLSPASAQIVGPRVRARRMLCWLDGLQFVAVYTVAALAAFCADLLGFGADATAATFITLYMSWPLALMVWMASDLAVGNHAVESLYQLERDLMAATPRGSRPYVQRNEFSSLRLQAARFTYPATSADRPASIGPIDLELVPGSITFLAGGNGSGKSTLLKLITGLYPLSGGRLLIDGTEVDGQAVRGLFASVFTDFHLFDRLYDAPRIDADRVQMLLYRLGLAGKTKFVDGAFTTTDLSTGQRKRLALLVATIDDRPVYVFDEWAADQDPEFRAFFYTELLPDMREAGKAIIAATHDDRYFSYCDKLIVMEAGQVARQRIGYRQPEALASS